MKPFIIKNIAKWNPDGIYGIAPQPINTMLLASEVVDGVDVVTSMKISDGKTRYKDLKELIGLSIPDIPQGSKGKLQLRWSTEFGLGWENAPVVGRRSFIADGVSTKYEIDIGTAYVEGMLPSSTVIGLQSTSIAYHSITIDGRIVTINFNDAPSSSSLFFVTFLLDDWNFPSEL